MVKLRTIVWDEMTKLAGEDVEYSSFEFFLDEVDEFAKEVLEKAFGNDSPGRYRGWVSVDFDDPDMFALAEFLGEVPLRDFIRILPDNRVVGIDVLPPEPTCPQSSDGQHIWTILHEETPCWSDGVSLHNVCHCMLCGMRREDVRPSEKRPPEIDSVPHRTVLYSEPDEEWVKKHMQA